MGLNQTGHKQARALAERLSEWALEAVYSSPLRRALETARPIAERHSLEPRPLEGIIDIDYGRWQGLSPQELSRDFPEHYALWLKSPHLVQIPGGEDLRTVKKRVEYVLGAVQASHPEGDVVLVSHQVVCKVILLVVLELTESRFWSIEQDNAALSIFESREGGYVVSLLNDTCHLRAL